MPTFLQLVERLHTESGAAGVAPTSVLNQRGEALRLVGWVAQSDLLIQNMYVNWKFLRSPTRYSQVLTADMADYTAPATLATWDEDTFRILEAGTTIPQQLDVVEYEYVKSEVLDTNSGLPARAIIMPDNALKLDQPPDDAHTVSADYYTKPVLLAANADVSRIPERFHAAIWARALMMYGNHENAPEAKANGAEVWADYRNQLENDQLPHRFGSKQRTGAHFEVEVQ